MNTNTKACQAEPDHKLMWHSPQVLRLPERKIDFKPKNKQQTHQKPTTTMLVTALVVILLTTIVYFIHVKFFKLTPIDPAKKLVVVTGAAQGIGLATVHKLIQLNCVVIAADIQKEKLQKELGDRENVHLLHVDVTNLSDIESKLVDKVKELKLPVFGVVNNAGIAPTSTSALVDKTDQETMLLTQVNLLASQRIVKALYPYMVRVKGTGEGERIEPAVGSCIVNISSILSFMPLPFSGYYCMVCIHSILLNMLCDDVLLIYSFV